MFLDIERKPTDSTSNNDSGFADSQDSFFNDSFGTIFYEDNFNDV